MSPVRYGEFAHDLHIPPSSPRDKTSLCASVSWFLSPERIMGDDGPDAARMPYCLLECQVLSMKSSIFPERACCCLKLALLENPRMLKLEREKAPFLEEAPGKLEPRWQSTKVKLVQGQAG